MSVGNHYDPSESQPARQITFGQRLLIVLAPAALISKSCAKSLRIRAALEPPICYAVQPM